MVENLSNEVRKARKPHTCDWCGGLISIGEKYEVQTNKFEGNLYRWKNHEYCTKLYFELSMCDRDDGYGISQDEFNEAVREYLYDQLSEAEMDLIDENWIAARVAIELIESHKPTEQKGSVG